MLAELAAANAAFAVIKQAVSNGKDLANAASAISDFVGAKEELKKKGDKRKRNPFAAGGDLEEFMALEKIREQEESLREMMIWAGRPGMWNDWQKFQAEARKERQRKERELREKREKIIQIVAIVVAVAALATGTGGLIWWVLFLKGVA